MSKPAIVKAPFYAKGPGVLVYFSGGGREYENMPFAHHMRLGHTFLAVNGCEMARWEPGDAVVCRVHDFSVGDAMETSSE